MKNGYVIGVDFGTDSVRAIIATTESGEEVATAVFPFSRWQKGRYCDASKNRFRQHPLDYIESLEEALKNCLNQVSDKIREDIKAISIATTGSTPVAVNKQGKPLALTSEFAENPNAMFLLWKDHTSAKEANEINHIDEKTGNKYLKYVGGSYSSEWYWAKLLHVLRKDEKVKANLYTFVEQSDWIPYLLTGEQDVTKIKRNVCAAGHKGLWASEFKGLPPKDFFIKVDPVLGPFVNRFGDSVYQANQAVGNLSQYWADRLGLSTDIKIGVGAIDAHVGAVGGEIKPYFMSKVLGTSTCDMMVVPKEALSGRVITGISGQVEDSIVPGFVGLEAGQSAFGDIYAWFRDILLWSIEQKEELKESLLPLLGEEAEKLPLTDKDEFALDWFNGRRTPHVNPEVKGMLAGLSLGSTPPRIYRALVEATCFGSKAIMESIEAQGIKIKGVNALGGIATKSPFVIQMMADVLDRTIHVTAAKQPVALGAAMFAAVVAGVYKNVEDAGKKMGTGYLSIVQPNKSRKTYYDRRYEVYLKYGNFQNEIVRKS